MLLAEEDGELLGFTACGESRDPDAGDTAGELRTLFVAAGGWGRGVGTALMAAALDDTERTEEVWADIREVRYRRSL